MDNQVDFWIVPHTHWDREWYLPFQAFRARLAKTVEGIITTLRADAGFAHFMLDGQTVVLEDCLEVRPDLAEELASLVRAGRIAVGPWYLQPDVLLVSGESLIRNLERGRRLASPLGGEMRVGYLPDSFGHPGSLPAVLSGFGIESASMMRGPGPELERPFFSWTAKDGSRVLVCSLIAGYGNGADLDADAATISQQLSDIRAQQDSVLFPDVPLLVMNGTDHRPITAGLPDALAGAGLADRARIGSLAELISLAAERLPENLPQWQGELRSPLRSPILAGCTSARSWIKQEDQAVSTLLEREAEPLAALAEAAGCGSPFPAVALDLAWTHFLQNQPHDSICGCSIDAVHDDMRFRYAQARGIAENIVGDAAAALAARLDTSAGGVVALNPGPSRPAGLLSFTVARHPVDPVVVDSGGAPRPTQLLAASGGASVVFDERLTPAQVRLSIRMVRNGRILGYGVQDASAEWESVEVLRIQLVLGPEAFVPFDWDAFVARTLPLLSTPGLKTVRAIGKRPGLTTVLFSAPLPAFGASVFSLQGGARAPGSGELSLRRARSGVVRMENACYALETLPDGALQVRDKRTSVVYDGLNRIEDCADRGDTYDFDPTAQPAILRPRRKGLLRRMVRTRIVESGPVRAAVRIEAVYSVPASLRADRAGRSRRRVEVAVVRHVSLVAGSSRIECRTEIVNTAADHRMRVLFSVPGLAARSEAGGTFECVARPARPSAIAGALEDAPSTHPFTGFVSAVGRAGLSVLARGLREYELLPAERQSVLAVTLFRAVGWLSRADLHVRRDPAGPDLPTPGAQQLGAQSFEYALVLHAGDPLSAGVPREWEDYRVSPRVNLEPSHAGPLGRTASLLDFDDPGVVFSSLRRAGEGRYALRFYDLSGVSRTVKLRVGFPVREWQRTRLDGTPMGPAQVLTPSGEAVFDVRAFEIVTVELRAAARS